MGVASMRQEEAFASSWIFRLTMIVPVVLQARTRKWSRFQPITTSQFLFFENVLQKLSNNYAEFKTFSRGQYPGPSF